MAIKFARMTRLALRKLERGDQISEHSITAKRLASGDIGFVVNIMVDRERIHRSVGKESEGMTPHGALDVIAALRTKAREDRLDLPKGQKTYIGFASAAQKYLAKIANHPKLGRNLARKSQHIETRLSPYFGDRPIAGISEEIIAGYVRNRQKSGVANATISRELSTLSHFLNCCITWGWAKQRPKIAKLEESSKKISVLTETEQSKLLQAAINDQDPFSWLFVAIALGSGMRHGEILRTRWEDISFDQCRIFIVKAKAGQRTQPIPKQLTKRLKVHWATSGRPNGYLFPTQSRNAKHPHRMSMATQFKRCVVRADLNPSKVTPHILRHTAITTLVKSGVDLPTIQRFSGHKTLAMVLRYTQLSDEHVDKSISVLDGHFADISTPKLHNESVAP